jgi:hypothetical protein
MKNRRQTHREYLREYGTRANRDEGERKLGQKKREK